MTKNVQTYIQTNYTCIKTTQAHKCVHKKNEKNGNWPSEKVQNLKVSGALSSQTYVEGRGEVPTRYQAWSG
jgi:hypothetical protein